MIHAKLTVELVRSRKRRVLVIPATPPKSDRPLSLPATRRTFLPAVAGTRTLLAVAALVAVYSAPAAAQDVTFALAVSASSPAHSIWAGVTAGTGGTFVVSPAAHAPGYYATGVPWADHGFAAYGNRGQRKHGNSWRHRRSLGVSCWDAWRDPWFAYWPYCDSGAYFALGWRGPGWHHGWSPRPAFGYAWAPYSYWGPDSYWGPAFGWTFAVHVGTGWGWHSTRPWRGRIARSPWSSIYVTSPVLWVVSEPPARVVRARPSRAVGSGGWVTATAPGYKEDPAAPVRTATPRTGSTAEPTRAAIPSRTVAGTPTAAGGRAAAPSPSTDRPPLGTPIRLGRPGDTDASREPAPRDGPSGRRAQVPSAAPAPRATPSSERSVAPASRPAPAPSAQAARPAPAPSTRSAPAPSARPAPVPSSRAAPAPPARSAPAPSARSAPAPSARSVPAPSARSAPAPSARSAPAPSSRSAPAPSARSAPAPSAGPAPAPSARSAPAPSNQGTRAVPAPRSSGG